MRTTKLSQSIFLALTGATITLGVNASALASHTMYNTYNSTSTNINETVTDGWTYSDGSAKGASEGAVLNPWVGTVGGALPFEYIGKSALNWAAEITRAGDTLTISRADAIARYGLTADIDTGMGAWRDKSGPGGTAGVGWAHNVDIGLFRSTVTTDVSINLTAPNNPDAKFGVTLFTGMDTGENYNHHARWNQPPLNPFTRNNPFGTTGVIYKSHEVNVDANNAFEFTAEAGKIYSIYIGGYLASDSWLSGRDYYNMTISTVPVPAAVWLFGSALIGLVGNSNRRNKTTV
ncbi:MAG: hypothetical protein CTY19_15985 [Methylomonas sp.]|jgi:hypothetical protein|nr:MAG: hypothetical protein CTY19_15985 [Methylomonas sp.]